MPLFHRSASSAIQGSRRARPAAPSCRGGASSMLRLAQPAAAPSRNGLGTWLSRAASVLAPAATQSLAVRPSEFAPSRWLVGH